MKSITNNCQIHHHQLLNLRCMVPGQCQGSHVCQTLCNQFSFSQKIKYYFCIHSWKNGMVVLLQIWIWKKKMERKLNNSFIIFFFSKFWAGLFSINLFLNIRAIILLGTAPAGFAQQCPRCNNGSSEVLCRLNFVTWGVGRFLF